MPELPEVEVVRRGLAATVVGARVSDVEVLDARALKRHAIAGAAEERAADFASRLRGAVLGEPARRGKFLWVPLLGDQDAGGVGAAAQDAGVQGAGAGAGPGLGADVDARVRDFGSSGGADAAPNVRHGQTGAEHPALARTEPRDVAPPAGHPAGLALLAHLGMSGQLLVREPGTPDERHLRVRILLEVPRGGGCSEGFGAVSGPLELRFSDQRLFGSLAIDELAGPDKDAVPRQAAHIARDVLDAHFDADAVVARMRSSARPIKAALLDQGLVSGIGNIYADEALWRARIHWARPARRIAAGRLHELLAQVRAVMLDALAEGGTSFDALYVNVNGESGYFARSLRAYGRAGLPCERCGTLLQRAAFAGRSSFFCPRCQRR